MASDSEAFIMDVDSDGDDSVFGEENHAVARLQTQKTATTASPKPPILQASTNASKKSKKTVEQMYQKKSPLEHILLRPDTYST
jgi:DNA topoisomerase-2